MPKEIIPQEVLTAKIFLVRGRKVMLDRDLAALYGVQTKMLTRAVRRNIERFPDDFMFQLTRREYAEILRCQIGALKRGKYSKYLAQAFTRDGVSMLSTVLKSKRAIEVNIQIIRTFNRIRELISTHADLLRKLEAMEKKYDYQFKVVFEAIKNLLSAPAKPAKQIGFTAKEKAAVYP